MSYTVPNGENLGDVLGLRHDHPAGIATRQNPDGTWELTGWPAGLGARPTQQDVNIWAGEVGTRRAAEKRARVKAALRGNDPDTVRFRAVLKVVMASLVEVRSAVNSLRSEIAAASSLADLKARATAIGVLSNRNWQQVLAAVDGVIDAGQGEE